MMQYIEHPDDPMWQTFEPPDEAFISFNLTPAMGDVSVVMQVHDHEPELDPTPWDRIDEAGAEFGYRPPVFLSPKRGEELNVLAADILASLADGWHMVRMSCSAMQEDIREQLIDQTRTQIDIWPIGGPADHRRIKWEPATPRPRKPVSPSSTSLDDAFAALISALAAHNISGHTAEELRAAVGHEDAGSGFRGVGGIEATGDPARWFTMMGRLSEPRLPDVVPGFDLLRPDAADEVHSLLLDAWQIEGTPNSYPSDAGISAYTYIPEYLPIAERDGTALVIDVRPGPASGAVRLFDKVDADDESQSWPSIADFVRALAESITNQAPLLD